MAEMFEPTDWDARHPEDRKPRKRVEEGCSECTVAECGDSQERWPLVALPDCVIPVACEARHTWPE